MSKSENTNLAVQDLLDREAIRECLYRYCRGVDRGDEKALRATYWEDATDRHGPYQGTASGFCDWAMESLKSAGRMIHLIGNIMIELHGERALAESYFHAVQEERKIAPEPMEVVIYGRYIDRFEKRGGEWKVAARTVVYDWVRKNTVEAHSDIDMSGTARRPVGSRYPADTFYEVRATLLASGAAQVANIDHKAS